MKLLVFALAVALLFTVGESVTDSPLNKCNFCCCAAGTPVACFSLDYTVTLTSFLFLTDLLCGFTFNI